MGGLGANDLEFVHLLQVNLKNAKSILLEYAAATTSGQMQLHKMLVEECKAVSCFILADLIGCATIINKEPPKETN